MMRPTTIGNVLYRWRSFTALPLVAVVLALGLSEPWSGETFWPLAIALGLCGSALRTFAAASAPCIDSQGATIRARTLVVTGAYSLLRHPRYVGNLFLVTGLLAAFARPWAFALVLPLVLLALAAIVRAEDAYLAERFSDEFRAYRDAVPALLPLGAWRAPLAPFDWSYAVLRETLPLGNWLLGVTAALLVNKASAEELTVGDGLSSLLVLVCVGLLAAALRPLRHRARVRRIRDTGG